MKSPAFLVLALAAAAGATAVCEETGTCSDAEDYDETYGLSLLQTESGVDVISMLQSEMRVGKAAASDRDEIQVDFGGSVPQTAIAIVLLLVAGGLNASRPEKSQFPKYVAEFLGTFMLILSVGCNVLAGDKTWGVTSIACTLMVSIYALGSVSGANFNPAVSVALGLSGKMAAIDVASYVLVQFAAGIMAAVSYGAILGKEINLAPSDGHTWQQAGLAELLYTFMLTFVVLNVACTRAHAGDQFYGLAIGFTVIAGGYGAGSISGGCFNPAVALALDSKKFGWCFTYMLFEFLGCALASVLFRICRPEEVNGDESSPRTQASKLTSEFLGTYMLVLTVGLNVLGKSPAAAFSIAAALMSMIFALGSCSGAHFNPAVTMAIVCSGRQIMESSEAVLYMLVQVAAGICAAFTYSSMMGNKTVPLGPVAPWGTSEALIGEWIFTFLLSFVVLSVATVRSPLSQYFGLAIGSCVIAGGYAIGGLSGGSLNPAVSAGLALSDYALNAGSIKYFFYYGAAELAGGVLAAGIFRLTHAAEYSKESQSAGL